jgi:hypothetical protein
MPADLPATPEPVDLQKIDRRIVKEPGYTCKEPLYGMLVLGPAARTRVWMVLDKSKVVFDHYDILYVDLNANGDLTQSANRIVGQLEDNGIRFRLPDFKDPSTGVTHTDWSVRVSGSSSPSVMVSLKWRNGFKMGGGYPEESSAGYLKFAGQSAKAPLLWANGDGPFRFQRWYSEKLTIGASDDLKVFVGQQGVGAGSFWAFQEHFLPEAEGVQATLIYQDAQGKEQRLVSRMNDRC